MLSIRRFNPNRSLDPEQISLDCWADGLPLVRRRSGLRRERTKNKMPTRKWKMTGSYLFNYDSYHNAIGVKVLCGRGGGEKTPRARDARAFPGKFAFLLSQPSQKGRKRMEKEGETKVNSRKLCWIKIGWKSLIISRLLKVVRNLCANCWFIVGYKGCLWRLWKRKDVNPYIRAYAREKTLTKMGIV